MLTFLAGCAVFEPEPPYCSTAHREVALEEPVDAGFSAAQVLSSLGGTFTVDAWDDGERGEVTVEVEPRGRILACEGHDEGGNDPIVDRIDLEVRAGLSTPEGRFGRTKRVFASTDDGEWARLRYPIDAPEPAHVDMTFGPGLESGTVSAEEDGEMLLAWPYDLWTGLGLE